MENRTKRARGSNWNHAHTMALAELKKEASLNKEDGRLVWEQIARTLSSIFLGQSRTGDQCRRRWDTLVKVYNHIENYCVETGAQDLRELDEDELASMKLDTAYHQGWYDIVKQVCSQRKRKERCDRDVTLARRSKGSHSVELPERPPDRDTLCPASTIKSVTHHEQSTPKSTTTYAQVSSFLSSETDKLSPEEAVPRFKSGNDGLMLEQSTNALVSSSPSLEVDKLSPEEEVLRLKNGNDGLMLEVTQLRQRGQVSHEVSQEPQTLESANLLPHTFPAENGAQLRETPQEDVWNSVDAMPIETSTEDETELELTELIDGDFAPGRVGARPEAPVQDHVEDHDSFETGIASSARESNSSGCNALSQPALHSERSNPHSLEYMPRELYERLQNDLWWNDHVEDHDSFETGIASSAREWKVPCYCAAQLALHSERSNPHSLEYMAGELSERLQNDLWWNDRLAGNPLRDYRVYDDLPEWEPNYAVPPSAAQPRVIPPSADYAVPPFAAQPRVVPLSTDYAIPPSDYSPDLSYVDSLQIAYPPRYNLPSTAFITQDGLNPSAITTSSNSSRSADSTITTQSRRWSLKVMVLKILLRCGHARGRKERAEDMEMESKQTARPEEKARKKALMSRKENVPAMLNAASSMSAASATRGDEPLQEDTQRTSKQAALDRKEEETRSRKAERQQVRSKSSSKCVPVGKLCAKWSRKLFPDFHGQSSQ